MKRRKKKKHNLEKTLNKLTLSFNEGNLCEKGKNVLEH